MFEYLIEKENFKYGSTKEKKYGEKLLSWFFLSKFFFTILSVLPKISTFHHIYIYIYIYMYVYWPNSFSTSMMRHKVNFMCSLTDLNSVFSISKIGCRTKVKESSLPKYLQLVGEKLDSCLSQKYMSFEKCKQSHVGLNSGYRVHFFRQIPLHHVCLSVCVCVCVCVCACNCWEFSFGIRGLVSVFR